MTEEIKQQTSQTKAKYDDIEFDLEMKKKFYRVDSSILCSPTIGCGFLLFSVCDLQDESACAFNIESLQIKPMNGATGTLTRITVDGVETDISDKGITMPANVLVDTGIGRIGGKEMIAVSWDAPSGEQFEHIITGEKPQGLILDMT